MLSLTTTLGACAVSGRPPVARLLPAAPGYVEPVEVDEPRKGEDPVAVAARERAGRLKANGIIRDVRDWYQGVRGAYSKGSAS